MMIQRPQRFSAVVLSLFLAPIAFDHFVPAAAAQESASASSSALEEIVVTARRREESLQDVPISISAFSADQVEQRGITNLIDLDRAVPNLSLGGGDNTNGSNTVGVTIRGVGDGSRINLDGAVGFYIDDVFVPRLTGTLVDLLDVESIEVLRGPQGTLFGRNTTGGAVRYSSRRPVIGDFDGYLKATAGDLNHYGLTGMVNFPMGQQAALRMSGYFRNRDGYVDNLTAELDPASVSIVPTEIQDLGNNENWGVRVGFRFMPMDNLTIDLTGAYIEDKGNGPPIKVTAWNFDALAGEGEPCRILARGIVRGRETRRPPGRTCTISRASDRAFDGVAATNPALTDVLSDTFAVFPGNETRGGVPNLEDFTTELLSAVVFWQFNDTLSLTSRTASLVIDSLIMNDNDYTPIIWRERVRMGTSDSFSQELLLNGESESIDWTAGLYYFSEEPEEITRGSDNGTPDVFIRNETLDADAIALFGEGTFRVTDALGLTAGYRWTRDDKTLLAIADGPIRSRDRGFVPGPDDPPPPTQASGSSEWTSNTWRVSVQYDWSDNVMTYFSASTGFRSGGFNNEMDLKHGPQANYGILPFDPEEVDAYELGLRSDLAGGLMRLNATVYWQEWTNRQLRTVRPDGLRFVANAGDAETQGVELDLLWQATADLLLYASAGTIDGEWTAVDPLMAGNILLDSEPHRMPDLSYALGALHSAELNNGMALTTSVNYGWTDDQYSSSLETRTIPIEAHGLLNARVKLASRSENWWIALFCTNCFDEDYIVTGGDFTGLTSNQARVGDRGREGYRWEEIGRPQEWGIEFGLDF